MKAWPNVALGERLRRSDETTVIDPAAEQHEVTIKLWGKGVNRRRVWGGASRKASALLPGEAFGQTGQSEERWRLEQDRDQHEEPNEHGKKVPDYEGRHPWLVCSLRIRGLCAELRLGRAASQHRAWNPSHGSRRDIVEHV
jgi:hypothetical protein